MTPKQRDTSAKFCKVSSMEHTATIEGDTSTQQRILAATAEVLSRNGKRKLSLSDVAAQAGDVDIAVRLIGHDAMGIGRRGEDLDGGRFLCRDKSRGGEHEEETEEVIAFHRISLPLDKVVV